MQASLNPLLLAPHAPAGIHGCASQDSAEMGEGMGLRESTMLACLPAGLKPLVDPLHNRAQAIASNVEAVRPADLFGHR